MRISLESLVIYVYFLQIIILKYVLQRSFRLIKFDQEIVKFLP